MSDFITDAEDLVIKLGSSKCKDCYEASKVIEKLLNGVEIMKAGRHSFNDLNDKGKTIFDFFNVWLDQQKSINAKLRVELEKLK